MDEGSPLNWPRVFGPDGWAGWTAPQSVDSGIEALAALVVLQSAHAKALHEARSQLIGDPLPQPVLLVGVAGPVASGKSTIAAELARCLQDIPHLAATEVVSTDGFLRPNVELDAEGLTLRKGFPESYDLVGLRALHGALRRGDPQVSVPVYAHEIYDIADEPVVLDRPEILVLEGVNALQGATDGGPGPADLVDLAVYIDVEEDTVIGWFTDRFLQLTIEARTDAESFYGIWAELPDDEVRQAAREVWDDINGVNLRDHIAPSRTRADIDVVKRDDHEIVELRLHPG